MRGRLWRSLSTLAYGSICKYGSSTLCRFSHGSLWMKGEHVYTVSPMRKVHQAYAMVIEGNCQMKIITQCLIPGVFLYRRIVRCMRRTSIFGREVTFSSSLEGRSSSIDFVWILVMIANIEHTSDPNHRASATQMVLLDRVQGRHEKAAPPQKVAWTASVACSRPLRGCVILPQLGPIEVRRTCLPSTPSPAV
jgi:hypothetical protein